MAPPSWEPHSGWREKTNKHIKYLLTDAKEGVHRGFNMYRTEEAPSDGHWAKLSLRK